MAILKLAPWLGLVAVVGGCGIDPFACSDAEQCDWEGGTAVCLPDGTCAYPDDSCPSGLRRSPNAPMNPGACTPDTGPSNATDGTSSSGPTPQTTSTTTPPLTSTSESSTGETGNTETCAAVEWFPDEDADGFGDARGTPEVSCVAPKGTVENADDCNDADPRIRPDHLQCDDNPGLIAWYRLDEAADAGFALDEALGSVGTLEGAPVFGGEGAFGTSVRYAGHPDRIEIAETVEQFAPKGAPGTEGTNEIWALPDVLDEACIENCAKFIVHVSDDLGDGFGGNTPDLHIHLAPSGPGMPYQWRGFVDGAFGGGDNCNLIGTDVEDGEWTHVAFRWTETSCALLVDGVVVDSDAGSAPSPLWTLGRIGHPPSRPDRGYEGSVDELMMFDHSRTDVEIRRDCGRPPCPPA